MTVRLPWFPFYLNDWETDQKVRLMGPVARSFFLALLIAQWREGSIPPDRGTLRRLLVMPADPRIFVPTIPPGSGDADDDDLLDYEAILDQVLDCFRPDRNGGLQNAGLESIRAEQINTHESRRRSAEHTNAKRSASGDRGADRGAQRAVTERESESESESESSPIFNKSVFVLEENARAREATPGDLAKELCLRINFPASPGNITAVAAALEAIRGQEGFATYEESCDWLQPRAETGREKALSTKRGQFDRFFFEDAEYNFFAPWTLFSPSRQETVTTPECIVGKCKGCGRPRLAASSWSDYCADSCRDAQKRGAA